MTPLSWLDASSHDPVAHFCIAVDAVPLLAMCMLVVVVVVVVHGFLTLVPTIATTKRLALRLAHEATSALRSTKAASALRHTAGHASLRVPAGGSTGHALRSGRSPLGAGSLEAAHWGCSCEK